MREAELWARLESVLGRDYARTWAQSVVMADLGSRTVMEALDEGLDCKKIWRAAWTQLELPEKLR